MFVWVCCDVLVGVVDGLCNLVVGCGFRRLLIYGVV